MAIVPAMSSAIRELLSASVPHQEASTGTPTSGFTAVNGRTSPPQNSQLNGTTESGGQHNGLPRSQPVNSWQQVEARNGGRPGAAVILAATPPREHRNHASATRPGKRKRHESDEDSDDSSSPHTPPDNSPKRHAVKPSPPGPPLSLQGSPEQGSSRERQNYPPLNTRYQYDAWHDERNEDSNEARLVAALEHDMELEHQTSGEDVADGATTTPKSTVMITAAGVQVDTSRRKRVCFTHFRYRPQGRLGDTCKEFRSSMAQVLTVVPEEGLTGCINSEILTKLCTTVYGPQS